MRKKKKVIKRHFKWKVFFKIFVLLFFVGLMIFFLFQIKTSRIIITGNTLVSDNEIIVTSGFKNYPYLFRESTKDIKERLKTISLIDSVNIHKSILGTLRIEVMEAKPLFYNRNNNKLVLANKKEIESENLYGVPTLINYVPDTYYIRFIEELGEIDTNVLSLISEIEYQPWTSNDVTIDDTRFFLRMSDGNHVYVNLINLSKLNNYIEIYASLEGKSGTLYLDSSSDKISFSEFTS